MVPIFVKDGERIESDQFVEYILNKCKEHRERNRALAFSFLVYDFEDYTIKKIIEDKDYWTTLDRISGEYLSIFYVNSHDSWYKKRIAEIQEEENENGLELTSTDALASHPSRAKSTPLEKTIELLRNEFKIGGSINHPFIIFFQIDGENIIDFIIVELKEKKIENAFLELKDLIENAVDSVRNVTPDNYENYREIFNLIRNSLSDYRFLNFIANSVLNNKKIITIINLIKTIASGLS